MQHGDVPRQVGCATLFRFAQLCQETRLGARIIQLRRGGRSSRSLWLTGVMKWSRFLNKCWGFCSRMLLRDIEFNVEILIFKLSQLILIDLNIFRSFYQQFFTFLHNYNRSCIVSKRRQFEIYQD